MSVPFGQGTDGLPVGIQVLAPATDEHTMFRAGAHLKPQTKDSHDKQNS